MFEPDVRGLTGKVITRYSPEYEASRQEWNRAIQRFPLVIVYCSEVLDVRNAVRWAVKNQVEIRIRSGGHHYEGYSVGNGVIVIDLSGLNFITSSRSAGTITIGGGVKNEQLYEYAGAKGFPFAGGTCPTVGVSGYVLGGGWGYSSRLFGLGCDSLLELELVDAEGKVLKANHKQNSDLFWACRGAGGGNFGIVVSMTFRLPPKTANVTLVQLFLPEASAENMIEFLAIWQKWLPALDRRMTLSTSLYDSAAEGMAIYGRGFFYGSEDEAKRLLLPFSIIPGMQITAETKPFLQAVNEVEETYPPSEKFKSTGRFVYKTYSAGELTDIAALIQNKPPGSVFAALTVYALGGKVSDVRPDATAFFYRDARYILGIQSVWEEDRYASVNKSWVVERFRYLETITAGSFVNFPISELRNYEEAYFGGNVKRLREVNDTYDPGRVFQFPQAIR
ncbi:FAD-binding protein [Bacillus mangrovi]|uniref:FAD-binding protein n=1 Tax=Metabacillus mangrovi TaxID=1491830 RepID=A0A7X2V689_9BACI|nr:FAD-binding oxidoreductase [Metabacillus mangrovi]MTH54991.1 FAD-binding protein [Metabacillus mangrovi]